MRYSVTINATKSLKGFFAHDLSDDDTRTVALMAAEENGKRLIDHRYNPAQGTVTALMEDPMPVKGDMKAVAAVFSPNIEPKAPDGFVEPALWPAIGFVVLTGSVLVGTLVVLNWTIEEIKELVAEVSSFLQSEVGTVIIGGIVVWAAIEVIKFARRA